jgi:FkbM family methyltransferase
MMIDNLPNDFLKKIEELIHDSSMPPLGLINLVNKYGYSYLVPLTDSFYKNPVFSIPNVDSANLTSCLNKSDNPVFSKMNPTWMQPIIDVVKGENSGVFLDIGAFVGSVTIHLQKLAQDTFRYVAFEPNPVNRKILFLNLAMNGIDANVDIEPLACSQSNGVETFMVYASSSISGRLSSNPKEGTVSYPIEVTTICSYLENKSSLGLIENSCIPLILKIDTEGHEWQVLRGIGKYWGNLLCCILEYWPSNDLTYEKYLLEHFYVLKIRSCDFSNLIPYQELSGAEELKAYGDESIRASSSVDVFLIPRINGHKSCATLLELSLSSD